MKSNFEGRQLRSRHFGCESQVGLMMALTSFTKRLTDSGITQLSKSVSRSVLRHVDTEGFMFGRWIEEKILKAARVLMPL
jgi:hypothetical protein